MGAFFYWSVIMNKWFLITMIITYVIGAIILSTIFMINALSSKTIYQAMWYLFGAASQFMLAVLILLKQGE